MNTQMQTKTLPASQAKNNFGAIVHQVRSGQYSAIIVENRGEPMVAIVGVEELQAMKEFREQARRREALNQLRALRAKIQARNKNKLNDKEASSIANRFSRELIEDLEKEGKIRFEHKAA